MDFRRDRERDVQTIGDRFSDLTLLLRPTQPKGYEQYYNTRYPLIGKEISLGSITKTDMYANDLMSWFILECRTSGQIDLFWDMMTWYQNDWKASMSVDHVLLDKFTSSEIRYTTSQEVHDYQHLQPTKKKGFIKPKGTG